MADVTRPHTITTTGFTHEPETIFAGTSYKHEASYGTEDEVVGQGFKKFYGLSITPTINKETKNIEVQGITLATGVLVGPEYTTWSGSGSMGYRDFGLLIDIISDGRMQPSSYTLQHFDLKSLGCAVNGFSLDGTPMELNGSLSFVGKKATKGNGDPTNPAADVKGDDVFFNPQATKIYIDDKLVPKVNAWSFEISDIWAIANYVDITKQSIAQTRITGNFSITTPMDANCFWGDNETHTVRIENYTEVGNDDVWFTIEFKMAWNTPDAPGDTDNIWTLKANGTILHDGDNNPQINIQSGIDEDVRPHSVDPEADPEEAETETNP